MRKSRAKPIPVRVQRILDRMARGERLVCQIRPLGGGETGRAYAFEPSGKPAAEKASVLAISKGLIVPVGDGLFGPEDSQTWVLPREALRGSMGGVRGVVDGADR
jgi:hypothetical protein